MILSARTYSAIGDLIDGLCQSEVVWHMGDGRLTSCDTDDGEGREEKLLGEHRGWNYAITVTSSIVSSVQLDASMRGD
jgi:hypothetical protein